MTNPTIEKLQQEAARLREIIRKMEELIVILKCCPLPTNGLLDTLAFLLRTASTPLSRSQLAEMTRAMGFQTNPNHLSQQMSRDSRFKSSGYGPGAKWTLANI